MASEVEEVLEGAKFASAFMTGTVGYARAKELAEQFVIIEGPHPETGYIANIHVNCKCRWCSVTRGMFGLRAYLLESGVFDDLPK